MARYIVTLKDGWKMAINADSESGARTAATRFDRRRVGVDTVAPEQVEVARPMGNPRTLGVFDRIGGTKRRG